MCDLSEGVSQVTENDPVIQMFLLIKKFTYLVAEGKDNKTKCFEFMAKRYIMVNYNVYNDAVCFQLHTIWLSQPASAASLH